MYFSKLIATGACVPKTVISNQKLSELVDTSDEWISSRTGIRNRHFAQTENASDLAIGTARQILSRKTLILSSLPPYPATIPRLRWPVWYRRLLAQKTPWLSIFPPLAAALSLACLWQTNTSAPASTKMP